MREQLTGLVKQVTSTLTVGGDPRVPLEERSLIILVVKRATTTMGLICDPETPDELRGWLVTTVQQLSYALAQGQDSEQVRSAARGGQEIGPTALEVSNAAATAADPKTPEENREELARTTSEISSLLKKISSPSTSQEEKTQAEEAIRDRATRMNEQHEEAASAQGRPEEPLGKAAVVCVNAIFEAPPEDTLVRALRNLVPPKWGTEGVKDFWKTKDEGNDQLDVSAQLENNEHVHAPFEIAPLITVLAEIVPESKLLATLGKSARYCLSTADYLDEEGIPVGTWIASDAGRNLQFRDGDR
jgi:hypothetical protein